MISSLCSAYYRVTGQQSLFFQPNMLQMEKQTRRYHVINDKQLNRSESVWNLKYVGIPENEGDPELSISHIQISA
jgi:hypothetical protein